MSSSIENSGHYFMSLSSVTSYEVSVQILPHAEDLPLPSYKTVESAGCDIQAAVMEPLLLSPGARILIPTGLKLALPTGFEAQIRPRSGLALKHGITCLNTPGTIDADYRGEIGVILINLGTEDFTVLRGMRIAQLLLAPVYRMDWVRVSELPESQRDQGGFGSTGV